MNKTKVVAIDAKGSMDSCGPEKKKGEESVGEMECQ